MLDIFTKSGPAFDLQGLTTHEVYIKVFEYLYPSVHAGHCQHSVPIYLKTSNYAWNTPDVKHK